MAVTLYRWDDVGAPQMFGGATSVRGDLNAVLKACLVDGYGAKPAAGWTMPFEDLAANTMVLRNSNVGDGTGTYYRFNDNMSHQYALCRAYRDMTDVDTGSFPFPQVSQVANGLSFMKRSSSVTGGKWYIIACERMFYYFSHLSETNHFGNTGNAGSTDGDYASNICGDVLSEIPSDAYCGYIAGSNTLYDSDYMHHPFRVFYYIALGSNSGCYLDADYTGFLDSQEVRLMSTSTFITQAGAGSSGFDFPNLINGKSYYSEIALIYGTQGVRAKYPGLVFPCHKYPHGWFGGPPDEGIFAGQDWIVLPAGGDPNSGAQIIIRYNCATADWYT